ncbi:DUF2797 domain-containing protein [Motiliproteus sediminis]|uniref:DUF2797 domain-containing protein n=1 Tax=Motiliproteus sediminis TaxID=1468178 RepID=UPI001AEFD25C|nr:DUF2797 domain-containing protein [Motiliproteus sediminis]
MSFVALGAGTLRKMQVALGEPAEYHFRLDDQQVAMNPLLGQRIQLRHTGGIHCLACGRKTKKSFSQGYCYPCFTRLPECDRCIMAPEHCHFHAGTCRDEAWGERNCMTDHLVYLANSSGIKVGITRVSQVPTRWLDQGATQALPILRVATRQQSGLVEAILREHVTDRTQWQRMLKGVPESQDLAAFRELLLQQCREPLQALQQQYGVQAIQPVYDVEPLQIDYPVRNYPLKVTALNLDKTPEIEGTLEGIKGQYLILDTGVINVRKYGAYQVELSAEAPAAKDLPAS